MSRDGSGALQSMGRAPVIFLLRLWLTELVPVLGLACLFLLPLLVPVSCLLVLAVAVNRPLAVGSGMASAGRH